ncbi:ABC transporter substrate-binding protein [Amycolatopsis sp. K13G38]|uniref:ABC transporter substrate-binding protein n=1 Tax=Amycolatopsis acididurans TaxID=2724524 RepID=A0ABX1J8X7_9PSEU|nr:ABC transporter substrate-binding protein [Amycolatopsis acididurans]NKQ56129.1 ABC transporter substrate-binding protein [Amycolatopsis acididurans]
MFALVERRSLARHGTQIPRIGGPLPQRGGSRVGNTAIRRRLRLVSVLSSAVLLAAGLNACRYSGSGSNASGSSAGDPIEFVLISGTGPGTVGADQYLIPGANAAVSAINATGGVKGRQLKMTFCDTKGNVNAAGTCASSAVANNAVVASIGNYNYLGGTQIYPVFEKAGLAAIGVHGVGDPEYSSPVIYPTDVGAIGNGTGAVAALASEGLDRAAFISFNPSSYRTFLDAINKYTIPSLNKVGKGFKLDPTIIFPGTATDLSTYAAQTVAANPPAVILSLGPTQAITFLQALRKQGYSGPVILSAGVTPASQIKQVLGPAAGRIQAIGYYSHTSPGWRQFEADMAKYQPDAPVSETDVDAYLGVKLFADVVKGINGELTREAVVEGLKKVSGYDTGALTPRLSYTKESSIAGLPREFNPTIVNLDYEDGTYRDKVPTTFLNVFTGETVPAQ